MQRFSLYGVHKRDYQESVTIGQTDARTHAHTQTDAGQSDPYVPLCFAGDNMQRFSLYGVHKRDYQESVTIGQTDARTHAHTHRQTPDKVIPMCRYASQATQK